MKRKPHRHLVEPFAPLDRQRFLDTVSAFSPLAPRVQFSAVLENAVRRTKQMRDDAEAEVFTLKDTGERAELWSGKLRVAIWLDGTLARLARERGKCDRETLKRMDPFLALVFECGRQSNILELYDSSPIKLAANWEAGARAQKARAVQLDEEIRARFAGAGGTRKAFARLHCTTGLTPIKWDATGRPVTVRRIENALYSPRAQSPEVARDGQV